MHTNQFPDLFFTYLEDFILNIGNKNPIVVDEVSSFSQQPKSSPSVFDCV